MQFLHILPRKKRSYFNSCRFSNEYQAVWIFYLVLIKQRLTPGYVLKFIAHLWSTTALSSHRTNIRAIAKNMSKFISEKSRTISKLPLKEDKLALKNVSIMKTWTYTAPISPLFSKTFILQIVGPFLNWYSSQFDECAKDIDVSMNSNAKIRLRGPLFRNRARFRNIQIWKNRSTTTSLPTKEDSK